MERGDTGGEGGRGHRWRGGGDTGGEGGRGHRWRGGGDTGGEGEGTQVERGRGHRWRGGGDTVGRGRGHRWRGEGDTGGRGRGHRWRGGGDTGGEGGGDTGREGEGTQVERGRGHSGKGEGTQVERGRGHRGKGEGTQVERGRGHSGKGEGTQVERGRGHRGKGEGTVGRGRGHRWRRGRGHRWRGGRDTGGEGEGTQVKRGRGHRWRGGRGAEEAVQGRGVAEEGLKGGEKGDGKATLTLSMTASDNMIDRIPMAPKPTDAANPGRPMPQNIDTEKYLERERDVSTRRGGRKMCRGGRIEGREEELLTQYSSDHQGVPGKAKDSQSPTFTRNHDTTKKRMLHHLPLQNLPLQYVFQGLYKGLSL